jgi:hypothetical protein
VGSPIIRSRVGSAGTLFGDILCCGGMLYLSREGAAVNQKQPGKYEGGHLLVVSEEKAEYVHLADLSLYDRQVLGAISRFSLPDSITLYLKMLNFLFTLYFLMI